MSLLVETIRIEKGRIRLMPFHNARANRSRRELFGSMKDIDLRAFVDKGKIPPGDLIKCRILYDDQIHEVQYAAYPARIISQVQILDGQGVEYHHKWVERPQLDQLFQKRKKGMDEICILDPLGYVTDAYYFHFLFEKENKWFLPRTYLLPGVMRTYLLQKSKAELRSIHVTEINAFDKIHLINALNPPGKLVLRPQDFKF